MSNQAFNARCRVCTSEQKILIETLLARGVAAEAIASKVNLTFGGDKSKEVSSSSVYRHRKHMPQALVESLKVKSFSSILGKGVSLDELRKQESENLLAHLIAYRAELDTDIATARFNGDLAVVSSLAGRRNHLLETLAKLLGELGITSVTNNVALIASSDYLRLRTGLMRALMPFPQARAAVAAVMLELEAAPTREAIDVEVKEIASDGNAAATGNASPATTSAASFAIEHDISGSGHDDAPSSAQAAGEIVAMLHHDEPACLTPAPVINTELYIDGKTAEKGQLDGIARLSR